MTCQKGYTDTFLKTLNDVHKNISFTIEKCEGGSICFLDKELELVDNKITSKWYSKPIKGDKTMPFNASAPFRWKKSNITNFINRVVCSSYDDVTTDTDLHRMKRILAKNKYPYKLVENLIAKHADNYKTKRNIIWNKISSREDLHPKIPKIQNENIIVWNIKIPYTSHRINKIMNKLKFEIKKSFVDIQLNIIYTSKKLFSAFKPLLKPTTPITEKQGVVYNFECDCSETYIGETGTILRFRINQHFTQKQSSIFEHIDDCETFMQNAYQHPPNSTATSKQHPYICHKEFFSNHFTILDYASNSTQRKIKESAHILCRNPTLNDKIKDHVYHLYGV